jgi:glycosyltransferase involved in cell wall biosynthesis
VRLLILTPEFEGGGGIRTFYRNLAPALRECGVAVRVLEGSAVHAGSGETRTVDGIPVESLDLARLQCWWDRFPAYAATPGLRRHLAAAWAMWEQANSGEGADVVEASDWGLLFLPPVVESRKPVIVQGHGSVGQIATHDPLEGEEAENALERLIERAALACWAPVQTYSQANADFWGRETGRSVGMICPAVPLPRDGTIPKVSDRGLVVGRIQRWKGPHILCQAVERLGARAPEIDWYGRDTAFGRHGASTAANLAKRHPGVWGGRVRPHTSIPAAEVAARQAGALFNLVPSSWDVFNFTAAEAMASGRPVIVSTGAGASELIVDGENGFLFDAEDASSLVAAVERVLAASPARLAEVGAAGRETVRRQLDPATIAAARIAAWQSAIDSFRAAPPAPVAGWLGEICRPGPTASVEGAFLSHHPMRTLAGHLARRVRDKVGATVRRRRG